MFLGQFGDATDPWDSPPPKLTPKIFSLFLKSSRPERSRRAIKIFHAKTHDLEFFQLKNLKIGMHCTVNSADVVCCNLLLDALSNPPNSLIYQLILILHPSPDTSRGHL
jgi:hypothetical protein